MSDATTTARQILATYDGPRLRIMEVCGTHTHENFRLGIRKLLPPQVDLISGPGCPVCVTPVGFIDEAIWLAEHGVTITTFGDLVRVPGTSKNLAAARADGARVQVVYSPLDALEYAKEHADEQVCFLSVGFETTVPAACLAVSQAHAEGVGNFSMLVANKTMPNAYAALKGSADVFLYPGHVHAITGTQLCEDLVEQGVSGVLAGFTAKELLTAMAVALSKAKEGKPFFVNAYPRVVKSEGTPAAVALIEQVMEPCDTEWRGLGVIPQSGLRLRDEYAAYDARKKHDMPVIEGHANPACRCGNVLRGEITPEQCPLFGKVCTPLHPVGACMVSGEGACSAFYQYGGNLS